MSGYRINLSITRVQGNFPMKFEDVILAAEHFGKEITDCTSYGQRTIELWNEIQLSDNEPAPVEVREYVPYTAEAVGAMGPGEMIHRLGERFPVICAAHGRWSDLELKAVLMTATRDWPMPHPQMVKDNPQA